jgi:hypothetical protein
VIAAADGYSYLHLILVAGIIIFAVGAKIAVAHGESPLSTAARLTLCGGVALYLIGHAAFRLRLLETLSWLKLGAAGSCLAVVALAHGLPAWAMPAAVTLVLTLLVACETITEASEVVPRSLTVEARPLARGASLTVRLRPTWPVRKPVAAAEGAGFEPADRYARSPVFKTGAFDRSATPPWLCLIDASRGRGSPRGIQH